MAISNIHRVFGVDFSGAANAGRKIWIASGSVEGDTLHITDCRQAIDLPGGSLNRDAAIAALRQFIAAQSDVAIGLDFPFSLSQRMISHRTWTDFVLRFELNYPEPTDLLHTGRAVGKMCGEPLWRQTDVETKTPFPAHNLRLFRQTYHGIRDLLAPLVRDDTVRVLPMQSAVPGKPNLLEICPASTLKREKMYISYKGKGETHRSNRELLLEWLHRSGVRLDSALASRITNDTEGDALDSVVAAYATAQALAKVTLSTTEARYLLEGMVYC